VEKSVSDLPTRVDDVPFRFPKPEARRNASSPVDPFKHLSRTHLALDRTLDRLPDPDRVGVRPVGPDVLGARVLLEGVCDRGVAVGDGGPADATLPIAVLAFLVIDRAFDGLEAPLTAVDRTLPVRHRSRAPQARVT
jgi:hypothetical protein